MCSVTGELCTHVQGDFRASLNCLISCRGNVWMNVWITVHGRCHWPALITGNADLWTQARKCLWRGHAMNDSRPSIPQPLVPNNRRSSKLIWSGRGGGGGMELGIPHPTSHIPHFLYEEEGLIGGGSNAVRLEV